MPFATRAAAKGWSGWGVDVKERWGRGKHHTDVHARLAKRHAAREIPETGGEGDFTRDIAQAAKR